MGADENEKGLPPIAAQLPDGHWYSPFWRAVAIMGYGVDPLAGEGTLDIRNIRVGDEIRADLARSAEGISDPEGSGWARLFLGCKRNENNPRSIVCPGGSMLDAKDCPSAGNRVLLSADSLRGPVERWDLPASRKGGS